VKVKHINTHGGSIRVYVKRHATKVDSSVQHFLNTERDFGLNNEKIYDSFFEQIKKIKVNVNKNLRALKQEGLKLVGYGSPAKATTALNYFNIGTKYIDYIVEDNKLKHNKILPGVKIPIYSKDRLKEDKPDVVIIMAWNFSEEIKRNNRELIDLGIRFISIKDLQSETFI
jgi:hypothetical protein